MFVSSSSIGDSSLLTPEEDGQDEGTKFVYELHHETPAKVIRALIRYIGSNVTKPADNSILKHKDTTLVHVKSDSHIGWWSGSAYSPVYHAVSDRQPAIDLDPARMASKAIVLRGKNAEIWCEREDDLKIRARHLNNKSKKEIADMLESHDDTIWTTVGKVAERFQSNVLYMQWEESGGLPLYRKGGIHIPYSIQPVD